jgi:hypothetical protein
MRLRFEQIARTARCLEHLTVQVVALPSLAHRPPTNYSALGVRVRFTPFPLSFEGAKDHAPQTHC